MRKCSNCKEEKTLEEFNKKTRSPDGRQPVCRTCSSFQSKEYYKNHTDEHRETTKQQKRAWRAYVKNRLHEIKQLMGCQICHEDDPICLDFHHLDVKKKEFTVSSGMGAGKGWSKIEAELKKCACVCANCHRKIHAGKVTL